jgi:hypothetical protein
VPISAKAPPHLALAQVRPHNCGLFWSPVQMARRKGDQTFFSPAHEINDKQKCAGAADESNQLAWLHFFIDHLEG